MIRIVFCLCGMMMFQGGIAYAQGSSFVPHMQPPSYSTKKPALKKLPRSVPVDRLQENSDPPVISIGVHRLSMQEAEKAGNELIACAAKEATQSDDFTCSVTIGAPNVRVDVHENCIESDYCLIALITRAWCHYHNGKWGVLEDRWLCEAR